MPTRTFEIADYDVAVEPWSPIKRRIVVRSPADGDAPREEATLLFTEDRTETGLISGVDDSDGVSAWAYFDMGEFDDVFRLLESEGEAYLHLGHVSGTGATRSLYFISVETSASVPGDDEEEIESSLPFGVQNGEESLELPVDDEGKGRARDRTGKRRN